MKKVNGYAIQFLVKLLKIYSPSGREKEVGDFIADEMRKLAFRVEVDDVGNVVGEVGQGKPTILLCGHMDTVPGYIPVKTVNGKLYGRGAVDAKAALASMILAAHSIGESISHGKILVACVVEEESSGRGARHLIKKGLSADYAIFGEPSGTENIIIGYKGSLKIKLTCKTSTGHSATPWLFENAIERSFDLWKIVKETEFQHSGIESHFHSVTPCLIYLKGGGFSSNVPSKCEALIDIRVPPRLTCAQVYNEISRNFMQYQRANPNVNVEMQLVDSVEPFETDKKNQLVRAFSYAIRKVRGKTPVLLKKTGTSDMNLLGGALKIPSVAYGPGDSILDHTSYEHVSVCDYLSSIEVLKEALKRLLYQP
ncbi:MAG: M20/M25/M40 family metallo-hydrolase [Candidatus Bathyarchaeota archaeon]|nr:M20/M25/M40 family metallo-hydrolase [Candidatus Bathyarchaeota archaeon]